MNIDAISPEKQIVTVRVINADPGKIFSAFSNPGILSKWWGPAGFTNTFHEFDFRPGGRWKFTMHGPEKGNYENECEFEIIEDAQLITWKRISKPLFRVIIEFGEVNGGKTRLTFRQVFDSVEECEKIRKYTVGKNDENFDKLEMIVFNRHSLNNPL